MPSPVLSAVNSKEKKREKHTLLAECSQASIYPLPWAHFILWAGASVHGIVPFISAPAVFCLVPLNSGNTSVPKIKVFTHPVPQNHKSGQAGIAPPHLPGWKTCLKTRLWNSSQKDETQIKRHLTQGMVWNKDPGLFTLVASSWSTKVEGEGPGRDCPTAIQRISGPVLGTFCTQVCCQFDGFGLIMYFHHVPNKRELCGSIYMKELLTPLVTVPAFNAGPTMKTRYSSAPTKWLVKKILPLIFLYMPFLLETLGLMWGAF